MCLYAVSANTKLPPSAFYSNFMSDLKLYDEDAAFTHVKSLEFKRLACTKGETKAINYIQKALNKGNVRSELESFTWTRSTTILMKLAFLFVLSYVIIYQILLIFTYFTWIILLLDLLLVLIIYFGVKFLLDMTRIIYLGERKESKNVVSKIPAKDPKPRRPIIIFSAHYDSISVKYSHKMQLLLYISGGLLVLGYLLATLILSIWSLLSLLSIVLINEIFLLIRNIAFIFGVFIMGILVLILLNKRTNESTGSIDNATGVAILIELAKLLNKNPLENMDVFFLWCGAEEWGLFGSRNYCQKHFDDELNVYYDLDKSYNINIDMVGTYIGLVGKTGLIKKKEMNENLNDVLESVAKQQDIPLKNAFIPIGAGSDHMSFRSFAKKAEKKLQVCCFLSIKDGKYIHSAKDIAENCSAKILNGCIDICYNAIKSFDLRVE